MKFPGRIPKLPILKIAHLVIAIGVGLAARTFAATDTEPCASSAETRQLDDWLGNWTMG